MARKADSQSKVALQAMAIVRGCMEIRNKRHSPPGAYAELAPDKNGNPNWVTYCPAHPDIDNPSLHVSYHDRVLFYCHANCSQGSILDALTREGLWRQDKVAKKYTVNLAAHAEPGEDYIKTLVIGDEGAAPETVYTYKTAQNQPAFWVLRNDSMRPKIIKPLCSVIEDATGEKSFQQMHYPAPRPLYNLQSVLYRPSAPILVVEGEKTADAATALFPDHVTVTWAGGAKAIHQSDWASIKGREIVLCPDNDPPGIKAMEEIAKRLFAYDRRANVKLLFSSVHEALGPGWDFADAEPGSTVPAALLAGASKMEAADISGPLMMDPESAFLDLDRRLVPIQQGADILLVDQTRLGTGWHPLIPFVSYPLGSVACRMRESARIVLPGEKKDQLAVELWAQGVGDRTLDCFAYMPTTTERIVDGAFNTFLGFPHEPRPGKRHEIFLTHLDLLLTEGVDYFLDWTAHMLQHPEEKPGTLMLITGAAEGSGKTALGYLLQQTVGEINSNSITPVNFKSDFNGFMANKLLLYIDEFNLAGRQNRKQMEEVKSLITSEHVQINEKGVRLQRERSYLRIMGTTNKAVPYSMEIDARRDTILEARSHPYVRDTEYFGKFFAAMHDPETMANWAHFLMDRHITYDVRQAFRTAAKDRMAAPSDPVMNWLYDILCEGELPSVFSVVSLKKDMTPETSKWPGQTCHLPRSMVNQYLMDRYKIEGTLSALTQRLREVMGDEVVPNKMVRFDIWENASLSNQPSNIYCFLPLTKMRGLFEASVGRKIVWPEVATAVDDTNVVPLGKTGGF